MTHLRLSIGNVRLIDNVLILSKNMDVEIKIISLESFLNHIFRTLQFLL